jgi:hypothetical protein
MATQDTAKRRAYYQDNKERIRQTRLEAAYRRAFLGIDSSLEGDPVSTSTISEAGTFKLTEMYACGKLLLPKSYYRGLQHLASNKGVPASALLTTLVGALLSGDLDIVVKTVPDYAKTGVLSLDHLCRQPLYTREDDQNPLNTSSLDLLDVQLQEYLRLKQDIDYDEN